MFGPLGSGAIGANNLDIRESSAGSLGITAAVQYNAIVQYDTSTGALTVGSSTATSASLVERSLGQILLSAQDSFVMRYDRASSGTATISAAALYNSTVDYATNGQLLVGATTAFSATASEISAAAVLLYASTAGSAVLNRPSLGSLDISSTTSVTFLPNSEGAVIVDSAGNLVLSGASQFAMVYARGTLGELQISATDAFSMRYENSTQAALQIASAAGVDITINTSTQGDLYISGTSLFSRGYVRTSAGELELDASGLISVVHARDSQIPLNISGTTEVSTRVYTKFDHDSLVELILTVQAQGAAGDRAGHSGRLPLGAGREEKRKRRTHSYVSHANMGRKRKVSTAVEHVNGLDEAFAFIRSLALAEKTTPSMETVLEPAKKSFDETFSFQRFLQREVDTVFDSKTSTVSFNIRRPVRRAQIEQEDQLLLDVGSMPRTAPVQTRQQQLDEEDQLMLGMSEGYIVLDSHGTLRLRHIHLRRQEIERADLDMLGFGEYS